MSSSTGIWSGPSGTPRATLLRPFREGRYAGTWRQLLLPRDDQRLFLIHGSGDDNVHVQNTIVMADALQAAGRQFDLMIYPGRNHGIYGGRTRLHLFTLLTNFVEENLATEEAVQVAKSQSSITRLLSDRGRGSPAVLHEAVHECVAQLAVGLHRFRRVHVHGAHEPAGCVRTDRHDHGRIDVIGFSGFRRAGVIVLELITDNAVIFSILALAGLAIVFGAILGAASERFRVEGDPLIEQIDKLLPQTQCGQCGYPGCKPYATAIAEGQAPAAYARA